MFESTVAHIVVRPDGTRMKRVSLEKSQDSPKALRNKKQRIIRPSLNLKEKMMIQNGKKRKIWVLSVKPKHGKRRRKPLLDAEPHPTKQLMRKKRVVTDRHLGDCTQDLCKATKLLNILRGHKTKTS
ncbi:hypothetical protein TWF481_005371 [Arthrobotrys musiformis]|uniref:40S ribosomal protein S6 n=1 Tax=Arthrobotrys musiformis TaxID=47236 RepID=A0AAV9WDM8_9PEZI